MNIRILWMLPLNFILLGILILRFRKFKKRGDSRFDVFYVEDKHLIINCLSDIFTKDRYKLSEIKLLEIRRVSPYMAGIRVIRMDGSKEKEYYFDSSVYYRKETFRKKVDPAIRKIEKDLTDLGLSYKLLENQEKGEFHES